ncbi:MAG TPA: hypothetical protein VK400_10875, partial [Pyrinomonadaceae bacterium]|nr:hypothetical protein [Pyrinomonadaceae bacterium]
MAVEESVLQNSGRSAYLSNRTLGAIGMILSPMLVLGWMFAARQFDQPSPNPLITSLAGILYLLGAAASAAAMRNLRVTGSGTGAKILYAVQMTGLFLAMWDDVFQYAAPHQRATGLLAVADMAYPFSHVLMIVVGVAVVRAGVWRGWRRIPAFLVGFALPSFFGLWSLIGRENAGFIFPLMVTTGFFTLG